MSFQNEPQFVFVSAGRRSREVHEEYPAEMVSLYGSADGLVYYRYFENGKMDYAGEPGVAVVQVNGTQWRDFLSGKPGWREILLDPGQDFFIKPAKRKQTRKAFSAVRKELRAGGVLLEDDDD